MFKYEINLKSQLSHKIIVTEDIDKLVFYILSPYQHHACVFLLSFNLFQINCLYQKYPPSPNITYQRVFESPMGKGRKYKIEMEPMNLLLSYYIEYLRTRLYKTHKKE